MITQDRLKEVLRYDKDTGAFVWIKTYRNQNLGKIAGSYDKDGYIVIKVDRKQYRAHNLAWMYVHGKFPDIILDHKDGVKDNNSICNLREVTYSENAWNQRRAHKDSKHGLIGVDYNKTKKRYRARIMVHGNRKTLGCFATAKEAHRAYLSAKRELHSTCTI